MKEKQRLRQLEREWKVENSSWLEEDFGNDAKKPDIPNGYSHEDEFVFFEKNTAEMAVYKRFCRNIKECLEDFFSHDNRTKSYLFKNEALAVAEVKCNKANTKAFVWFTLPKRIDTQAESEETRSAYEYAERKLNEARKFISGKISQQLGLRYAIELEFKRDFFVESYDLYRDQVMQKMTDDIMNYEKNIALDENNSAGKFSKGMVSKSAKTNMFSSFVSSE